MCMCKQLLLPSYNSNHPLYANHAGQYCHVSYAGNRHLVNIQKIRIIFNIDFHYDSTTNCAQIPRPLPNENIINFKFYKFFVVFKSLLKCMDLLLCLPSPRHTVAADIHECFFPFFQFFACAQNYFLASEIPNIYFSSPSFNIKLYCMCNRRCLCKKPPIYVM